MGNIDAQHGTDMVDLSHSGEARVLVHPDDYDAFILSQREAVEALRDHHRMMSRSAEIKKKIDELLVDIAEWSKKHDVAKALLAPRIDDALIAMVAKDEDEDGRLHEAMFDFDLSLGKRYRFRLSFILFRASEEYGLESFVDPSHVRTIYQCRPNPRT